MKCAPERALRARGAFACQWARNGQRPLLGAPSLRVEAKTRACVVASLANIDILAAPRSSHSSRFGHNPKGRGAEQRPFAVARPLAGTGPAGAKRPLRGSFRCRSLLT